MKTKQQAVRSLTTQQLKDLADSRYLSVQKKPARQDGSTVPPLSATPLWELKERVDALRQREQEGFKARPGRNGSIFPWLFEEEPQKKSKPAPRPSNRTTANGRTPVAPAPWVSDEDIHRNVKQAVGETILGNVTMGDVLAELHRRGVSYRSPLRDGVLTIEDSDLVPAKDGQPAKIRPTLAKFLKDHQDELSGIRIDATQPVELGRVRLPNGFLESTAPVRADFLEVKQLHAVGDVTVEEYLHAEEIQARGDVSAREIVTTACTVRGNVDCGETLKFTAGSSGSKQTVTGNVQCGHLVSEDDRAVNVNGMLGVKGNCSVPRLSAQDLSVGWELQNVKSLAVTGKANLTKLSSQLDARAEFQGVALQESVQQLRDQRQGQREQTALENQEEHGEQEDEGQKAATRRHGRNEAGTNGASVGRSR